MSRETGPTYTRLRCCSERSCQSFSSMLQVGECYLDGGLAVRDCSSCSSSLESSASFSK